ncbi:uncharacterized protein [Haliotis cracherodii]|uniref:uncharacterized protein n=1 Tax=Haliotis cracherodii TaxID=6455 RepID=UPI0039EB60F7
MIVPCKVFSLVFAFSVHGLPLDVTLTAEYPIFTNLTTYGVDISRCRSITFQVKTSEDHGFTMTDSLGNTVMSAVIGGWSNSWSRLLVNGTERFLPTADILSCNEYRRFWLDWNDHKVAVGKGVVLGEAKVMGVDFNESDTVAHILLERVNSALPTTPKGEMFRSRFELVNGPGKFSDGLVEEKVTTFADCIHLCADHRDCGMFSYNSEQPLCALFDRMTSSFNMTSENGWKSGKMLYCNM